VRAIHLLVLCAVVSPAFVLPARAQSTPSVSDTADRPGFADSSILLGRGRIQIESGLAWEQDGRGASLTKTSTLADLELHGGLTPRLEFSLAWDGLVSTVAPTSESHQKRRSTGWADVRLGAKVGLVDRPDFDAALIWYTNVPVGSSSVSSRYADPRARFAWGVSISEHVAMWGTADLGAARDEDNRVRVKPAASASVGTTVVRALNGFVGIIAESPPIGSKPDAWSVEYGFVLPLGVRTQIDAWSTQRVAGGSPLWSIGAGFVRRLR